MAEVVKKETKKEKVTVKSLLDSVLVHENLMIMPKEIVIIDSGIAEALEKKGFVKTIEVKAI